MTDANLSTWRDLGVNAAEVKVKFSGVITIATKTLVWSGALTETWVKDTAVTQATLGGQVYAAV